jgi:GT2 family glycosyltransferase
MDNQRTKVAIVIPVHNRRDTTLQALRSLSRIDTCGLDVHIVIFDDGSTDGTSDAIRSTFPEVEIIDGDGSAHYAAGTNRGIEAALKHDPKFIVTANDDSIFHERFLQQLILTARDDPRRVVGAMLLLWDKPHQTFQMDFKWQTTRGGWQQNHRASAFDFPDTPFEVDGLAGNCVLVPAEAIRECGLMDEKRFPHGWGDIQYFVRLRRHGWRLMVDPKALVWCEPNTNPAPLHTLPFPKVLKILFRDRRHPLNLQRQFVARWESAPNSFSALAAYTVYLFSLIGKAIIRRSDPDSHA